MNTRNAAGFVGGTKRRTMVVGVLLQQGPTRGRMGQGFPLFIAMLGLITIHRAVAFIPSTPMLTKRFDVAVMAGSR